MEKETVLISACLLGIPCQYNGQQAIQQLSKAAIEGLNAHIVPVCPEQLCGLATPRSPVEIQGGDGVDVLEKRAGIVTPEGDDLTEQFIKGAELVAEIAELVGAKKMITQHRSPSCSSKLIYDGTFSHKLKPGFGVCAALLKEQGLALIDINDIS